MNIKICSIESCDKPIKARGWCRRHYQWWTRYGHVDALPLKINIERRFWSSVSLGDHCWDWIKHCTDEGYGSMTIDHRPYVAHRYSYELLEGEIPEGLELDHLCRNRSCVNPDHLEPVTNVVNNLRGEGPCAKNARKTHCKHGHEFTPENTYWRPSGGRTCITCRDLNKARYAREK